MDEERLQPSEVMRLTGTSHKALRHYEDLGLLAPERRPNGYRAYDVTDVAVVHEIRNLQRLGLSLEAVRPFVACVRQGHKHGDDCAESLAMYRDEIERLGTLIDELHARREALRHRLAQSAARGFDLDHPGPFGPRSDYEPLPDDLPVPVDDGAADHLPGLIVPSVSLHTTSGHPLDLSTVPGRWVLFVYPTTGVPGHDMPEGWDTIPGARGCTPEACGFRDSLADLQRAGIDQVYGLSVQPIGYQRVLAARLGLPYALVSDPELTLHNELNLPTFEIDGATYYQRLTMVIHEGKIQDVFYPVFPPDQHAQQLAGALRSDKQRTSTTT